MGRKNTPHPSVDYFFHGGVAAVAVSVAIDVGDRVLPVASYPFTLFDAS